MTCEVAGPHGRLTQRRTYLQTTASGSFADDQMDSLTPSNFLLNQQLHYTYSALPNPSRNIRLVRLHKAEDGSIVGALQHYSTDKLPTFHALSYMWGKPGDSTWITIDNCRCRVQANLFRFLDTVLSQATAQEQVLLYVDAVCVNQEDVPERNEQVKLMSHIYKSAEQVLCYLGLVASKSAFVFEVLRARHNGASKARLEQLCVELYGSQDRFELQDILVALVDIPYLNRVWIVQEIVLAKSITLYCGGCRLPWQAISYEALAGIVTLFEGKEYSDVEKVRLQKGDFSAYNYRRDDEDFSTAIVRLIRSKDSYSGILRWRGEWDPLFRAKDYRTNPGPLADYEKDFEQALISFGDNKCTDPRDHIYGILGIVNTAPGQISFPVDYGQNAIGLFFTASAYVAESRPQAPLVSFGTLRKALRTEKKYHSIRPFARDLHRWLGLDEHTVSGPTGFLRQEVLRSIPNTHRGRRYPVKLAQFGEVIDRTRLARATSPSQEDSRPCMKTWSIKHNIIKRLDDKYVSQDPPNILCFTLEDVEPGDKIVTIDWSNCAMILRPVAKQNTMRTALGPEFTFVARCVVERQGADIDRIERFLDRRLPYCKDLTTSTIKLQPLMIATEFSISAEDLLILATDLGSYHLYN